MDNIKEMERSEYVNNEEVLIEPKTGNVKVKFDDLRCERRVSVYAKINKDGYITALASDIFLKNFEGWTKIDEGDGDRFVHPQVSYFEDDLVDNNGKFKYKLTK
jgi:hypothetical protein